MRQHKDQADICRSRLSIQYKYLFSIREREDWNFEFSLGYFAGDVYLDVSPACDVLAVVEVCAEDDEAALAAVHPLAAEVQVLHARHVLPVVQLQLCT